MIDPASGWFDIHQYDNKKSITVANIAEQEWFARYPWSTQVTFDRGSEFIEKDFKHMLVHDYGIKRKPITVRNPQVNAIVEKIHQLIASMVRILKLETYYLDVDSPWKGVLSATAFAIWLTYHTTLKKTTSQLVFRRDLISNISHVVNWELNHQNKQRLIDKNNRTENAKQVEHVYKKDNLVLLSRSC